MSGARQEDPCNLDAEQWLLGGVFQDSKAMAAISSMLEPCDFFSERNGHIWQAMQSLHKDGKPIDPVSALAAIQSQGHSVDREYVFAVCESAASAANIEHYVELVGEASSKRRLIAACRKAISKACDPSETSSGCLRLAGEEIASISRASSQAIAERISDTAASVLSGMRQKRKEGRKGSLPTSFYQLDNLTGGLRPGELTVIGARTSVGKTSFALSILHDIAKFQGSVVMFSLEMNREQIAARAMSRESGVSLGKIMKIEFDMEDSQKLDAAIQRLGDIQLHIDYRKDYDIDHLVSAAHALAARLKPVLVVVDHIQIIDTGNYGKAFPDNRNIAIGRITRALKVLAGNLGCHVIALSQLNRLEKGVKGKDAHPRLSDLRDSGNIEQDSDTVLLMHRATSQTDNADIRDAMIYVAKNRSGPTGEFNIKFNPQNAMFCEYENLL